MGTKTVGDSIMATCLPLPAGAVLTDITFTFSSPALFEVGAQGSNYITFAGLTPSSGQTLTVTARGSDGQLWSVTKPIPDVVAVVPAPPPVATGIDLIIT